jgi:transcriptional regulator NrdR family protein
MAIFTTSEAPDLLKSLSVTDGKNLQPFSRDKLFLSVHDSLKHRKTATNDASWLTDTIISRLYPLIASGSLNAPDITQTTTVILKRFDKAATTYYQAYHPNAS